MKNKDYLIKLTNSDLGKNVFHLYEKISNKENKIFIDLGVRHGISSEIMLIDSQKNNNKVVGVDVINNVNGNVLKNPNYQFILGDSVTVGKNWTDEIGGVFIDTLHIKEQVLCELYYWYKFVEKGGFIIFHDTNWPLGKNDIYDGVVWDRVEYAIQDFFNIKNLNYEDEFIKVDNYPESWGMTIVEKKQNKNFIENISNWPQIFNSRNRLINFFWGKNTNEQLNIEFNINV